MHKSSFSTSRDPRTDPKHRAILHALSMLRRSARGGVIVDNVSIYGDRALVVFPDGATADFRTSLFTKCQLAHDQ